MSEERWTKCGAIGAPLIAVHSWRYEPVNYERLSAAMGGQLIYSLHHPDPDVHDMPRRVDDWVDHHEQTLWALSLAPPYRIVGWSFGGVLAVELARRLRQSGLEVEYVGLLDSTRPRLVPLSTGEFVWHHLAAASAIEKGARSRYLIRKARFLAARRYPRAGRAAVRVLQVGRSKHTTAVPVVRKPKDPLKVSIHTSYLNYQGGPVTVPVHVYATEQSLVEAEGPVLRWLPWLHGGYRLEIVPGEHLTMFKEAHIHELGGVISADLEALDRRAGRFVLDGTTQGLSLE